MNSHLNIFKTYTATDREHQLENDLALLHNQKKPQ